MQAPEFCLAWIDSAWTCMPRSDWAAWVQAVGSIAAIAIALYIARKQSATQHASAMKAVRAQHDLERQPSGTALALLAITGRDLVKFTLEQLGTPEALVTKGSGLMRTVKAELEATERGLEAIPPQALAVGLALPAFLVANSIRHFRVEMEQLVEFRRERSGDAIANMLLLLKEQLVQIDAACDSIGKQVPEPPHLPTGFGTKS